MGNFIQSDIFFFITAVAVILVTIFVLVALWYIIRIVKNVKDVSEIVKRETVFFSGDLTWTRNKIKKFFQSLINLISRKTNKK